MKNLYLTSALALIASPALADITPKELWQSWQETNSAVGMELSAGSQTREGAVLVLRDVSHVMDIGFVHVEQVISQMRLEAMADGTVTVSYDTGVTATVAIDLPDTPTPNITMTGRFENTAGVVSGTADDYVYDFSIGRMQVVGDVTMSEESSLNSVTSTNAITNGLAGSLHFNRSEAGMNIAYSFTLDSVDNSQDATSSFGGSEGNFTQSQRTFAEGYTGEVAIFLPAANPDSTRGSLIPEGFTMNANVGIAHMNITQKTVSPFLNSNIEIGQQDVGASLSIDGQNMAFSTSGQNTFVTAAIPAMGPQPYRVEFANIASALSLPYRLSDVRQDAHFALSLGGVQVSDNIWAQADPENTLSRAPADFAVAADVSATLLLDWTNIEAVKAWDSAPALLHKIVLETFQIGFENAQLSGAGDVAFSNETDVPTPNGGALSFAFTGIPALLEKLGGLPLVDPAIIAQANGMLGIFTTDSEDGTRVSDIAFGPEGEVTVNGQRVR